MQKAKLLKVRFNLKRAIYKKKHKNKKIIATIPLADQKSGTKCNIDYIKRLVPNHVYVKIYITMEILKGVI